MINYKLSKKLKDAGFPQPYLGTTDEKQWFNDEVIGDKYEYTYAPTLSELIEACGDGFVCLFHLSTRRKTKWRAETTKEDFYGKTPEEAVANLWLKLQEANK